MKLKVNIRCTVVNSLINQYHDNIYPIYRMLDYSLLELHR